MSQFSDEIDVEFRKWTAMMLDKKDAEITRLRADLAAVTAERDRLREALKPFADDELHEGLGDGPDDERTHWPSFLLGDLRRAKEVYENTK